MPVALIGSGSVPVQTKILFALFLLSLPFVNPWVRGDGVGYYAYLRSALIDHDLNFENDYLAANESFVMSRKGEDGKLLPSEYTKTGYVENHFSVGPAMLWTPAIIVVHGGVVLANRLGARIPANGYSRPYLLAMAVTTACYGFLALLLAYSLAKKYFEVKWAFLGTVGIWLASSLPVYMYFNPSWSHAHSAFAVALFLWYWDRTRLERNYAQWAILGLMTGLMGNVYYPNAILLIFPGLEWIYLLRRNPGSWRKLAASGALFGAVFVLSLAPTFVTKQIIYGSPFDTGYPSVTGWHWASPALFQVLFSTDHGMFVWTPVLAFSVLGLIFLWKRDALLGGAAILSFLAYFYFIASYPDWDGISSYGNRFFVSLTPVFVLGLVALFEAGAAWIGKESRALVLAGAFVIVLTVWNAGFMFQWGTHMVPARGKVSLNQMVRDQFVDVPLSLTHNLATYFLHRRDMMQHIEREDIQQQKGLTKGEN